MPSKYYRKNTHNNNTVMSSKLINVAFQLILIILSIISNKLASANSYQCFKSIISFGDSLTDTGNAAYIVRNDKQPQFFTLPPYGETYFGRPTGRCSDGRLIIDFLAEELGIPLVNPFLSPENGKNSGGGSVNFAVAGATALDDSFFSKREITIPLAKVSLTAQLSWFKQFLTQYCHNFSDCKRYIGSSLVLFGEIGGNDYNHALFHGMTEAEVQSFVPQVIKKISTSINDLINLGAMTLIVPGNFPLGCTSVYLTYFGSQNERDYTAKTGCLTWPNRLAQYHNGMLQMELKRIQKLHPHTTIVYADYYNAAMGFFSSPKRYGFAGGVLKACCGAGGRYNVNLDVKCGFPPSSSCADPSSYVNWDGLHFTEAAYKQVTKTLFRGSNTTARLSSICAKTSNTGFYSS